ncbi:MAG: type II toxin-antitoxin system RelE/ParE family toxin [Oscillospiraceae bacterium]|nr:type II toxin-antitoxin system RelE/ParE family toxin [Oscillospiraceae bacterium]
MNNIKLKLSKKAAKILTNLNKPTQSRILTGIYNIPKGNIKPFKGVDGTYRLRVGDWRVLFSYPNKNEILIEKISSRGDAYKGG